MAPVTLAFDGREVPVATTCTGADGAVLATTEGEVTITLVREEGPALRYRGEGAEAETSDVAIEGGTDTTTYTAHPLERRRPVRRGDHGRHGRRHGSPAGLLTRHALTRPAHVHVHRAGRGATPALPSPPPATTVEAT